MRATVPSEDLKSIQRRIIELQSEHRDLDEVVNALALNANADQLLVKRMKKRKLQLKDQITRLKSRMIPDLDA
ncbi:MAG: DUF465 domain-containing protein [Gammaproteobacteria bacterium]